MAVTVYRHPVTLEIKQVDPSNDVQIAAVEKLGYVKITGKDIANEESLSVTYETVTRADVPKEPPALPKLTKPVPPIPTRDPNDAPAATPNAITREDLGTSKSEK